MIKLLVFFLCCKAVLTEYEPNWNSLDTRPLPQWYDEAKIGILLHWGVFSVPSFKSELFWNNWKNEEETDPDIVEFMKKNFKPDFSYQEFAKDLTAEFFNPVEWVELFKNAGAKYIIITSKYQDGYSLWPSKYSFGWNSVEMGAHRDLLNELGVAIKNANLKFGIHYSLEEWYNPMYISDKINNFTTSEYVDNKMLPQLYELVNNYEPDILWADADSPATYQYFKSTQFLAWLFNKQPLNESVVTNDRWGNNAGCAHGDFVTCHDRFNPRILWPHKWENFFTIDRVSKAYRRNANIGDYLSNQEIINEIASTISCNGSVLINIGITKKGTIEPIYQERLLSLGDWLRTNGEAIYASRPWKISNQYQNDSKTGDVWYSFNQKTNTIYATLLSWPFNNTLALKDIYNIFKTNPTTGIVILQKADEELTWEIQEDHINIKLPDYKTIKNDMGAWVLKIPISNNKAYSSCPTS